MARKGSKYKRHVYVENETVAYKLCELLSDLEANVLTDEFVFGDYYVVHFKASKDEFSTIRTGLDLQFKSIVVRNWIRHVWFYEHHKSTTENKSLTLSLVEQAKDDYLKGDICMSELLRNEKYSELSRFDKEFLLQFSGDDIFMFVDNDGNIVEREDDE